MPSDNKNIPVKASPKRLAFVVQSQDDTGGSCCGNGSYGAKTHAGGGCRKRNQFSILILNNRLSSQASDQAFGKDVAVNNAMDNVDLTLLQILVAITSMTTLLLAIAVVRQSRTQSALLLSEEKFSKAVSFSPDAVTISHLSDGCFIEVNDSFLTLTGYSRDEALGRTSIELGLWCDPSERRDLVDSIRRLGSVRNKEVTFRRKDGHMLRTLLSTSVFDIDRQPCLLTVVRDVTERQQIQDNLRMLAERDRLFGETAIRIHQYLDLEQILEATVTEVRRMLSVDRAFVHRIHSDSSSEIVAESLVQPFPSLLGRASEIPTDDIRNALEAATVLQIDDISHLEDTCPYRIFVQRYDTRAAMGAAILVDGALFGVLVVHQCCQTRQWQPHESELLERISTQMAIAIQQALLLKQVKALNSTLEQQVADRTAQLAQQMQEVQDLSRFQHFFLHAITHDLRTSVLGNLMVFQALIARATETVTLSGDLLERMRQGTALQLRKLDALQEIYAAKTTGLDLNQATVSLSSLVSQTASELALPLQNSHAHLTVAVPEHLPPVWVDPGRIRQVLHQLITNAIDHNASSLAVTVAARQTETGICCWVEDNGKGICPERCARLFDLCIDCAESRHYGGISLGLYRCRQILDAHHGTICVKSQPGIGTRLEFTLPAVPMT